MKELVVIRGKGGTGKTTVLASFAALAGGSVLADCDVDAPDLYLLLHPQVDHQEEFRAGYMAAIDPAVCTACGRCREVCRFDAISADLQVVEADCEGCGACEVVCPVGAVELLERVAGDWYRGLTPYGPMVYARLRPAEENSGKLVALVRREAKAAAEQTGRQMVLTDGPPGIGCPVIAAVGGADLALLVTEPTPSGSHDVARAVQLCAHFQVPAMVCVNKRDLNPALAGQIEAHCEQAGVPATPGIPFDEAVPQAIRQGVPLVEHSAGPAACAVKAVWEQVRARLLGG